MTLNKGEVIKLFKSSNKSHRFNKMNPIRTHWDNRKNKNNLSLQQRQNLQVTKQQLQIKINQLQLLVKLIARNQILLLRVQLRILSLLQPAQKEKNNRNLEELLQNQLQVVQPQQEKAEITLLLDRELNPYKLPGIHHYQRSVKTRLNME